MPQGGPQPTLDHQVTSLHVLLCGRKESDHVPSKFLLVALNLAPTTKTNSPQAGKVHSASTPATKYTQLVHLQQRHEQTILSLTWPACHVHRNYQHCATHRNPASTAYPHSPRLPSARAVKPLNKLSPAHPTPSGDYAFHHHAQLIAN